MSCDRCAALEEEIAWLRQRLGEQEDGDVGARLRKLLGLSPNETWILRRLYATKGFVSAGDIEDALGSTPLSIRANVSRLRMKMGDGETIENLRLYGYSLTPLGREIVNRALEAGAAPAWRRQHTAPYPWTPSRVTELRQYRRLGLSFGEISRKMTTTRAAVAGACYRYDLA